MLVNGDFFGRISIIFVFYFFEHCYDDRQHAYPTDKHNDDDDKFTRNAQA